MYEKSVKVVILHVSMVGGKDAVAHFTTGVDESNSAHTESKSPELRVRQQHYFSLVDDR